MDHQYKDHDDPNSQHYVLKDGERVSGGLIYSRDGKVIGGKRRVFMDGSPTADAPDWLNDARAQAAVAREAMMDAQSNAWKSDARRQAEDRAKTFVDAAPGDAIAKRNAAREWAMREQETAWRGRHVVQA